MLLLSPFYRQGNQGPEKLSDLPRLSQLGRGRPRIQNQAAWSRASTLTLSVRALQGTSLIRYPALALE